MAPFFNVFLYELLSWYDLLQAPSERREKISSNPVSWGSQQKGLSVEGLVNLSLDAIWKLCRADPNFFVSFHVFCIM